VEEEGDLRLLVFLAMEYERESSRTVCSVVPNCSEVGEDLFIVFFEIRPLVTCHISRFFEKPGQPDFAPDRPVHSPVRPGHRPGRPVSNRSWDRDLTGQASGLTGCGPDVTGAETGC
jgi:hypothetical protein